MKQLTDANHAEVLSDLKIDNAILFAYRRSGEHMYVCKTIGTGSDARYRFMNIGNIRTKFSDGELTVERAVSEALIGGLDVFLLESVWQLSLLINKYTKDQDMITDELSAPDEGAPVLALADETKPVEL